MNYNHIGNDALISFPMFGEGFVFNPPATYEILGFTFYIYGAIIGMGFVLAFFYCLKRSKEFGLSEDNFLSMVLIAVPLGIIGARLYFVAFHFDWFRDDPLSIITSFRDGGLAIYGGIIFGVLGAYIASKIWKFPFSAMLDVGCFGLFIGQTAGRWGNFFNREAFGSETDIFCRMGLTQPGHETIYVHPTFLYESVWNLTGFILLHIFSKRKGRKYDGQLFLMYIGWYGLGRVFIEGLRTDSLYLFDSSIRVSQLLAGLSLVGVIIILLVNHYRIPRDSGNLWVNRQAAPEALDSDEDI